MKNANIVTRFAVALGLGAFAWFLPAPGLTQGLAQVETVTGSITSGTTVTLPAWTPAPNDLILVSVALRDETRTVSVTGNGLTFVQVADVDNAQNQTGVNLFRAMGEAPTTGSITVTISGNDRPAIASATRIAGADTSGTNGSGAIEAVATDAGPPSTDNDDMKIDVTTLTSNAWAYAAGTHRLATFALPGGEIAISINNVAGDSGDKTTLSTWYEAVPTPGTVTLGADNDLNSERDWAVIALSIKPAAGAGNTAPTVTLTSPADGATFTAPATIVLTADAQDSDGTIAQVEFFEGTTLLATVTTPPYTFTLNDVQAGSYSFTAKATDNLGATATSAAVGVTVNAAAQVFFIHPDHLDTPRVITNQAGQPVWAWANDDPFGNNVPNEDPSGLGNFSCNLRLPGQYFDKETNLHYNYFRDYDPAIGRYVQFDPIGLRSDINGYSYVRGNPLSFTDSFGLQAAAAGGALPVPRPPVPVPGPGVGNPPSGGEVIPFPGGRDRPTDRPDRPVSGTQEECPQPDRDPLCNFTGLAGFSADGPYGGYLTCQYRCPRRGLQHFTVRIAFTPQEPRYLCRPAVPESFFR
jgi:RHS repeat-associated protein